ncbi:hypothetical protein MPTK2_4g91100P [Marchantia polymorpha subsp. ruderalis]
MLRLAGNDKDFFPPSGSDMAATCGTQFLNNYYVDDDDEEESSTDALIVLSTHLERVRI